MIASNMPPISTVRNAIRRERNSVVTADQALKVACKKRGWNINLIRQYVADNTVRKPGYLPCRKSMMRFVNQHKRDGLEYQAALAEIAKRYASTVERVAEVLAAPPRRKHKVKRVPEIGLCECGRTAALQMRYGKKRCYECHADYSRDTRAMPTEAEIAERCAYIRQYGVPSRDGKPSKGPRRVHEAAPPPVEVPEVHNLGVLSGRAGSWWASE